MTDGWMRHMLIKMQGSILDVNSGLPLEYWSCGIRVAHSDSGALQGDVANLPTSFDEAAAQDYLTDIVVPAVSTCISDARFSHYIRLDQVSANVLINSTGGAAVYQYTNPNDHFFPGAGEGSVAGGGASNLTNTHPPQCSVVASWRTAASRGPAHLGRIFLPPTVIPLSAQWGVGSSEAGSLANAVSTMLGDLKTTVDDAVLVPAVISHIRPGVEQVGTGWEIRQVAIGSTVDTQRRRRRDISESYTVVSVT